MIQIAAPEIGPEEIQAVNDVLLSGMIAQGPVVSAFEEAFALYTGTKYALAVNSGTAALHAALYAAGVGPGDEVITTPFSFIATINPILMLGARPVLVDIDPNTFNIEASAIAAKVTSKTKAIIPVHLYGQPSDMDDITMIAREHGLKIIEDACQAVGAMYGNKKAGNLGDLGCFSLYATKNIMSGEGGVVTTNNKEYADAIRKFRQHGMVAPYEYDDLGYNYRMTDLHAAIALEQVKKADRFNDARKQTAQYFLENLKDSKGLIIPKTGDSRTHVYHQFTVRVTSEAALNRDAVLQRLREDGIGAAVYYPKPLHAYPHIQKLGYKLGDFPIAEQVASEVLSLPVHPKVSREDARHIVSSLTGILNA